MNTFKLFVLTSFAIAGYTAQAQVKVGDNPTVINSNAVFELESTNKGVLFPRMALASTTSASPLSAFVVGMTVYNTATTGSGNTAVSPGLYYSDGTKWVALGKDYSEDHTLGSIAVFPYSGVPSSYLICNGQAVSRNTYAALYAKIGTTYGAGDGSTTFNLPDLRGEFIRGWDNGRGVDTGRVLGSTQADELEAHNHQQGSQAYYNYYGGGVFVANLAGLASGGAAVYSQQNTSTTGGSETRPRNIAMVYAIKAVETIIVATSNTNAVSEAAAANEPWYKVGTTSGATSNNDNVYINGNVGVGATSPSAKLDIDGGVRIGSASAVTFQGLHLAWNRELTGLSYILNNKGLGSGGIIFGDVNNSNTVTEWARFDYNGYLKIGSASAGGKLAVTGVKTGASVGTGASNDGPTQLAVSAATVNTRYNDWPSNWGGGISTQDIVGASTYFNGYLTRSDARLKTDIQSIDTSIFSNFMKIRPVTYLLKEKMPEMEGLQYGFIAQEIGALFPSMVTKASDPNGTIGMNYQALISPTIYVVQQQQKQIENLNKKIQDLEAKIEQLISKK